MPCYRLLPGVEPLMLDGGAVLFVSDWVRLKLEGAAAERFMTELLPHLADWCELPKLEAAWPGAAPGQLATQLAQLCEAGVLQAAAELPPSHPAPRLLDTLAALGGDGRAAAERLAAMRVVVFGVEDVGAQLATQLVPLGLRELILVDPFVLEPGNLADWPVAAAIDGRSRQRVLAEALSGRGSAVHGAPDERLTKDAVAALSKGADLLVGCFDRGFSAAHQWINRAALAQGTPAVFAQASAVVATVGPWVFPGESACYMCWRMRHIAASPSFDKTMAYEQHLDRRQWPSAASRPCLPGLAATAAGLLCTEIVTTLLGLAVPSLANAVIEVHGLDKSVQRHGFLHRPDCPACAGLHKAVRTGAGAVA